MSSIKRAQLTSEGKGFSLPHSEPAALASVCALRIAKVDFNWGRQKGFASLPTLTVCNKTAASAGQPPKEESLTCIGYAEIFSLLARNGSDLDEGLSNDQRVYTKAAALAFTHQIVPAFDFVTLALDEHAAVREANRSDPNSLLAIARSWIGWSRRSELAGIREQYSITTLAGALAVAATALKTFEDIIRSVRPNGDGASLFEKPSTFDCLAFAACSSFLYAEFAEKYSEIRSWQVEQRKEVPRLLQLAEAVRVSAFGGAQTSFFSLKPILPSADSSSYDGEKPYRDGRFTFLAATAAFASLYFLVTNAAAVVQVLEAVEGGLEDEGEE